MKRKNCVDCYYMKVIPDQHPNMEILLVKCKKNQLLEKFPYIGGMKLPKEWVKAERCEYFQSMIDKEEK